MKANTFLSTTSLAAIATAAFVIGSVGASGGVSQPQVHFEIRYTPAPAERPRPVDPLPLLPR